MPLTRQVDNAINRTTLIDVLKRAAVELVERPFTVAEAKTAREAFVTSATNTAMRWCASMDTRSVMGRPVC